MNGEQQTASANGDDSGKENENQDEEYEPVLSADCYFKDHGECQWYDCPCECHAGN